MTKIASEKIASLLVYSTSEVGILLFWVFSPNPVSMDLWSRNGSMLLHNSSLWWNSFKKKKNIIAHEKFILLFFVLYLYVNESFISSFINQIAPIVIKLT